MPAIAQGVLKSPAINLSKQEPDNPTTLEVVQGSVLTSKTFTFGNQGNVPQTLTVDGISDLVNCTLDRIDTQPSALVLQPGQQTTCKVFVRTTALTPGAPDASYSYKLNWTWA
jgi:hypothetical protein